MNLKRDLQDALEATLLRGASFDAGAFLSRIDAGPAAGAEEGETRPGGSLRAMPAQPEPPGGRP